MFNHDQWCRAAKEVISEIQSGQHGHIVLQYGDELVAILQECVRAPKLQDCVYEDNIESILKTLSFATPHLSLLVAGGENEEKREWLVNGFRQLVLIISAKISA